MKDYDWDKIDLEELEKYRISHGGWNPDRAGNFDLDAYYADRYGKSFVEAKKQSSILMKGKEFAASFEAFISKMDDLLKSLQRYPKLVSDFQYQHYRSKLINYKLHHLKQIDSESEYDRQILSLLLQNCIKETGILEFVAERTRFGAAMDMKPQTADSGETQANKEDVSQSTERQPEGKERLIVGKNTFCPGMQLEVAYDHFHKLATTNSAKRQPYLSERQFENFFLRAFKGEDVEKQTLTMGHEVGTVRYFFYQFYEQSRMQYETKTKEQYVRLLSDNIEGFPYDATFSNFAKEPGRKIR